MDERGLLDTEDSRHRTCTRIPVVNFETAPGKIHILLHFLGAGKEKKKKETFNTIRDLSPPKHNCLIILLSYSQMNNPYGLHVIVYVNIYMYNSPIKRF